MVRSLYNGVSGVKTQGFSMDVWAHNIANINNVGFTASIPEFKSIFYPDGVWNVDSFFKVVLQLSR